MAEGKKVFTLKDVSSHDFVVEYAQHLKKTGKMDVPKWVDIAKTGPFKELAPYDEDFYYIRAGALAPPGGSGVGAGGRWGGCGTPRSGFASEPPLPASGAAFWALAWGRRWTAPPADSGWCACAQRPSRAKSTCGQAPVSVPSVRSTGGTKTRGQERSTFRRRRAA